MTTLHTVATAAVVLGVVGLGAISTCRSVLRYVEIEVFPVRIISRAMWWRDHAGSVLGASLIVTIVGLAGLVSG
jgi:hypothetical protein